MITEAPLAARQPEAAETPSAPHDDAAGISPLGIQSVDEETFQRSLQKVATIHERLLTKLAE